MDMWVAIHPLNQGRRQWYHNNNNYTTKNNIYQPLSF